MSKTVGFKCGTYWAGNNDKGLPAHGSTILLLDPESGFPQALVNATYLNGYRTAAANAVAVSYLARADAEVLGVIGAGHQAEQEIRAVAEVRALSLIKIFTRSEARANWIADRLQNVDIEIQFTSAEDAVRDSDIVTTVTPSESPLVRDEWIGDGMHISAMGADDVGKHELDTAILKRASLFADYPKQSVVIGEFQHALDDGSIESVDDICALGLVTLGKTQGRESNTEITVFDSSGIAIQDLGRFLSRRRGVFFPPEPRGTSGVRSCRADWDCHAGRRAAREDSSHRPAPSHGVEHPDRFSATAPPL